MPGTSLSDRRAEQANRYRWEAMDDDALLDLRFRDLRLRIADSPLEDDIAMLHRQLERRGIRFRPRVWLSTEWFSPDGVPGIAVPFYAAHPRLGRLERRICGEAEGGNRKWRRRILRHEAGHALDTAFGLRRRADWRAVFGRASKPYKRDYSARPVSRRFVLHLGHWYAQSHPTEDFAETFAVWLKPRAQWRREYAGWPALRKLEFVDAVMAEIADHPPRIRDRSVIAPLSANNRTLREHYRRKSTSAELTEKRYDRWLRDAFPHRSAHPDAARASAFVHAMEPGLRRHLLRVTDSGAYLTDHVIETVRCRLRQLDLVVAGPKRESERKLRQLMERVSNDVLRRNNEKYVL